MNDELVEKRLSDIEIAPKQNQSFFPKNTKTKKIAVRTNASTTVNPKTGSPRALIAKSKDARSRTEIPKEQRNSIRKSVRDSMPKRK